MNLPAPSARQLLEQEERAWRSLPPDAYDRAVCDMLQGVGAAVTPHQRVEALRALADATLKRDAPRLHESRARIAEELLSASSDPGNKAARSTLHALFLLAWQRLCAEAAAGPDHIAVMPDLPPGALLPFGADPQSIADPDLRDQARELEARHAEEVERWNAAQRAIDHLNHLGRLVLAFRQEAGAGGASLERLTAAMSSTPGLPPALRKRLEDSAR